MSCDIRIDSRGLGTVEIADADGEVRICNYAGSRKRAGARLLCGLPGIKRDHDRWLCKKHYRWNMMIHGARHSGKYAPSCEELDSLLVLSGSVCPGCNREMAWLREDGNDRLMTLQHDRDGNLRFLCRSCNVRHESRPGDEFYSDPKNLRCCYRCSKWKDFAEFSKLKNKRGRWQGLAAICKPCNSILCREWRQRNREKVRTYKRLYARRRRAQECQ